MHVLWYYVGSTSCGLCCPPLHSAKVHDGKAAGSFSVPPDWSRQIDDFVTVDELCMQHLRLTLVCVHEQAQAVELLCRCDDIPDDNVELAVLKGLLTAVTSSTLHVHGQVCLVALVCAHPA